jgi:membrane-associated phospholipid phosphatase
MAWRARISLLAAFGGVGLLAIVYALAFHSSAAMTADRRVLNGFTSLDRPRIHDFLNGIAHLGDPKPFTVFALVLVAIALLRHRPRIALAVVAILAGANVTTQILKPALAHTRTVGDSVAHVAAASWPSGHATASLSLALCAVLVAPARLRPAVASAGGAFSIAVTFSLLALGWHFPSDVIGGYLIVGTWTALVVACVYGAEARWPRRVAAPAADVSVRDAVVPALVTAIGALGLAALIAFARPGATADYARSHTTFVVGAGAIAALGLGLATALALMLRR